MKIFYDPADRPIAPPADDPQDEHYLDADDLPNDSFDPGPAPPPPPAAPDPAVAPANSLEPTAAEQPPIDNETVFDAERILQHRTNHGRTEYLVKWVGYPDSEATWEPPEHLFDPRLLLAYHASDESSTSQ